MNTAKTKPEFLFWLIFILLLAGPFSARALERDQASEELSQMTKGPLIAVILPLSGPFSEYGKTLKKGYEQGFSTTEETPESTTGQYRVQYLDSKSDPETAQALISLLGSEGEVAIATGTPLNATAWTVSRACEKNSIPYLIVGADQDNLINQKSVSTFRLTPKHSALKQLLTDFLAAREPEIKSMGIIYGNSICAIKKARQLRAFCATKNLDLSIWKQWRRYSNNRDNFYDLLNAFKERQPGILFLISNQELTNRLWQQGQRLEIVPPATISIPTAPLTTDPAVTTTTGNQNSAASQLVYATPWVNPMNNLNRKENFTSRYNQLSAAGSAAAAVIKNCLKKSLDLTAAEIIKSLEATRLDTVYGSVKFTTGPTGHQNPGSWYLCRKNENGSTEIVFPDRK